MTTAPTALPPLAPPVAPAAKSARRPRASVAGHARSIVLSALLVNVLQVLHGAAAAALLPGWLAWAAAIALGLAATSLLARHWRRTVQQLANLRFGAALILVLAGAVMLGTFVHQSVGEEVFFAHYGLLAVAMTWLHLDMVFTSWWFLWLLSLFALSNVVSIARRRLWRFDQLGFLLTHAGLLVVLLGGGLGAAFGAKGMIHLEVGQGTYDFQATDGAQVELPFHLGLTGFEIQRRDPELRLYVVERTDGVVETTASLPIAAGQRHEVEGFGWVEVVSADADRGQVRVRVVGQSDEDELVLRLGGRTAVDLGCDCKRLRLARRGDDIINFVATLQTTDAEGTVEDHEVRVNQPLVHGDFAFYQANFDPERPQYAGIMVVRDPGLGVVYTGLGSITLGVLFVLLFQPRLARRRRRDTGGTA